MYTTINKSSNFIAYEYLKSSHSYIYTLINNLRFCFLPLYTKKRAYTPVKDKYENILS